MDTTTAPPTPGGRLIASPWHTLSILLVFTGAAIRQMFSAHGVATPSAPSSLEHRAMLRNHLISIGLKWGMA